MEGHRLRYGLVLGRLPQDAPTDVGLDAVRNTYGPQQVHVGPLRERDEQ